MLFRSRKVAHYFQEHPITVVSAAPLADILNNSKATGRVAKWSIELGPLDLTYKHPTSIKAQVLPDFTTEWMEMQLPSVPDTSNSWTMYFDGSKRNEGPCTYINAPTRDALIVNRVNVPKLDSYNGEQCFGTSLLQPR